MIKIIENRLQPYRMCWSKLRHLAVGEVYTQSVEFSENCACVKVLLHFTFCMVISLDHL